MVIKLLKANFKNDLSHMVTYCLIMVLAVFTLHTGLAIFLGYRTLHKEKQKEYDLADMMVINQSTSEDMEKSEEIVSQFGSIESYDNTYPLVFEQVEVESPEADKESDGKEESLSEELIILPYEGWSKLEAPHFIEVSDEEYDNPIYISLYYNNYFFNTKLGDDISLKLNDKYYTFQVAGIYEGLLSNLLGVSYVSPDFFDELKEDDSTIREYEFTFHNIKLADGEDSMSATGRLSKTFSKNNIESLVISVDSVINSLTYMQNMIAAMLVVISVVITVIAMIIIYFRISNSIEQNIINIGALKALGYTSTQIRMSMICEFTVTTFVATVIGIIASYNVLPVFEEKMRSYSGLVWDIGFEKGSTITTAVMITATVIFVAYSGTGKITELDPVTAIRFGIKSHNFKKNYAPLENTKGPLTWVMALKSVMGNKWQNIVLITSTAAIGAVTSFAVFLFYNGICEPVNYNRLYYLVFADVDIKFDTTEDLTGEISQLPEVETVNWIDEFQVTVEGNTASAVCTDDWFKMPHVNIYKGRSPKYANEVALGGFLALEMGVGIGDEVTISYGDVKSTYLVTGLEQSAGNVGNDLSLTEEGAKNLNRKPYKNRIEVFVTDHSLENTQRLVRNVQAMYGDKIVECNDNIKEIKNGDDHTTLFISMMISFMVLISAIVIVLSLNLVVKTLIIKKKKELGIKKAIGFTSRQLRAELALSMLPQILTGASIGSILGCLGANNAIVIFLRSLSIMKSNMEVYPWMVLVSIFFEIVISFAVIWIISYRIKKISPYSLITE